MFLSGTRQFLLPFALIGSQFANGQDSSDVQNAMRNLVRMHDAWGAKASSPDTSLAIKESSRSGNVIKFGLHAQGLPRDKIYAIVTWPVTQKEPSTITSGVTLDASGQAVCAGTPNTCSGDQPDDPIDIATQPVPGEPLRLGLVSADGDIKVFAKVVPVPLRGEDRGCSIEGVLLTPGSELVLVAGSGFPANSELSMESDSEGERHNATVKADPAGRYTTAIGPYKQGVLRGTLKVSLKSTGCSPSVRIPWGRRG
jgi:hypothetical protein